MSTVSPPTSRLRFLDPQGAELAVPREWTPALVEALVPVERLRETRLLRQGEPLKLFAQEREGELRVFANWPRSGTGRYQLTLDLPEWSEQLIVVVAPEKISSEAYGRLIEELQTELPASIAIALQRLGALTGLQLRPPGETTFAGELLRLRHAVHGSEVRPGLAKVLSRIATDPHRVLRKTGHWSHRDHARRLEPVGLVAAFQRPDNLEQPHPLPVRLPDIRVEQGVDTYENRLLRGFYEQVDLRLRRLAAAADAGGLLAALTEAEQLLDELKRARYDASFLDDVGAPDQIPLRVTTVLTKRTDYRAMFDGYLEFRRIASVAIDEPGLEAPLENLPSLYETWGTLHIIKTLLEVGEQLGYRARVQRLAKLTADGLYLKLLPGGEPAVVLINGASGAVVRLMRKRSFTPGSKPFRSASFTKTPDITVEVERPGRPSELYLFDSKYKLESEDVEAGGEPKKVDIDIMYAYRDAIRDQDQRHVVRYAAILYPGPQRHYDDDIEAISARPLDQEPLQERISSVLNTALVGKQ